MTVHDRAAGRATVWGYFDRDVPEVDAIADAFYRWAERTAVAMARLRGVTATRLDESPFADDTRQAQWLTRAGYARRRSWLHMTRPVVPDEAALAPRAGVTVRPVERHENGMPVATDLQVVHQMLETSFQDHFNSYRESFSEFVQRLREDPGHSWDHWWLAYVETDDGRRVPAGTVVCSSIAAGESGARGTYVEYIGVTRAARGRGVAKSLLATVIADAARDGRDRVALEVDADSPRRPTSSTARSAGRRTTSPSRGSGPRPRRLTAARRCRRRRTRTGRRTCRCPAVADDDRAPDDASGDLTESGDPPGRTRQKHETWIATDASVDVA